MENDNVSIDYDSEVRKFREMMLVKRRLSSISNHHCHHHHHNYHLNRSYNHHNHHLFRHQSSLVSRSSNDDNDSNSYHGSNILVDDFDDDEETVTKDETSKTSELDDLPPQRGRKGSQSWKNVRAVMAYYYALRKIKRNGANFSFKKQNHKRCSSNFSNSPVIFVKS